MCKSMSHILIKDKVWIMKQIHSVFFAAHWPQSRTSLCPLGRIRGRRQLVYSGLFSRAHQCLLHHLQVLPPVQFCCAHGSVPWGIESYRTRPWKWFSLKYMSIKDIWKKELNGYEFGERWFQETPMLRKWVWSCCHLSYLTDVLLKVWFQCLVSWSNSLGMCPPPSLSLTLPRTSLLKLCAWSKMLSIHERGEPYFCQMFY